MFWLETLSAAISAGCRTLWRDGTSWECQRYLSCTSVILRCRPFWNSSSSALGSHICVCALGRSSSRLSHSLGATRGFGITPIARRYASMIDYFRLHCHYLFSRLALFLYLD
jgi:hypothetical protein